MSSNMSRIGTSRGFSTNRLSARRLGALVVALASGVLMVLGSCLVAPAAHAATSVDAFMSAAQAEDLDISLDISDQDADECASDLDDLDVQSGDIKNCKWAGDVDLTITYADLDASKMDSYKKSVESTFVNEGDVTKTSGGYEYATGVSPSESAMEYYFSDTSVFFATSQTTDALDTVRSVAKSSGFDAPDPGTPLNRSDSSDSSSTSSESDDDSSDGSSSGTKADGDASKDTGDSASAKDSSDKGMSATAIVIIVVVAVLLVAGVIVIIVVPRRKPQGPQYPQQGGNGQSQQPYDGSQNAVNANPYGSSDQYGSQNPYGGQSPNQQ